MPFIDQTLGFSFARSGSNFDHDAVYSALASGDLAGMEASLFVTGTSSGSGGAAQSDARLTLSRNDPDANLLGPLSARSFALGKVAIPSLGNVLRGGQQPAMLDQRLTKPADFCTSWAAIRAKTAASAKRCKWTWDLRRMWPPRPV